MTATPASPAHTPRVLCFVPMYQCAAQVPRVFARFPSNAHQHIHAVLIVDNGSKDGGPDAARAAIEKLPHTPASIIRNKVNVSLGGSHKVAFNFALKHNFDYVLVLHGDDQADVNDILPLLAQGEHTKVDQLLGSRFMRGSTLKGYSTFRTLGNRVFNNIFSLCARTRIHDLGSGLNCYSVRALQDRWYLPFPNALTFNNYMLLGAVARACSIRFFPLTWREEDQRSNVKMVRQALATLRIPLTFLFSPRTITQADPTLAKLPYDYEVLHEVRGGAARAPTS